MNELFLTISKFILNEDFRLEARRASIAFSRVRKLSLPQLVAMLMSFTRCGVHIELNRFLSFKTSHTGELYSMSKSAFTQARNKLNASVFVSLNRVVLSFFEQFAPVKKSWKGFRPVAIDGSGLSLPDTVLIRKHFGTSYNQTGKQTATARISVAFDICNNLVLDARIAPYLKSEIPMAKEHLDQLDPNKHLLVFDRLYAGIGFFEELNNRGFKFCFRLSRNWKNAFNQLNGRSRSTLTLPAGTIYRIGKERFVLAETRSFRIVKFKLSGGQDEVLLTNLPNEISTDDLKHLYGMRWQVEECYKRIKTISQVEFFSGRTALSVEQDFFARIVMLNLASLTETQSIQPRIDKKLKDKKLKRKRQANKTQIYAAIKEDFYNLLWQKGISTLEKILNWLVCCTDIVRKNRSFKRIIKRKNHKKPINYKMA